MNPLITNLNFILFYILLFLTLSLVIVNANTEALLIKVPSLNELAKSNTLLTINPNSKISLNNTNSVIENINILNPNFETYLPRNKTFANYTHIVQLSDLIPGNSYFIKVCWTAADAVNLLLQELDQGQIMISLDNKYMYRSPGSLEPRRQIPINITVSEVILGIPLDLLPLISYIIIVVILTLVTNHLFPFKSYLESL
ncbi:hypothetical protein TBLA_0D00280 [Henningerozyma blattae CBS 6284]|uniref:Uncharacterized protein n=1 Tax=Henningerozyma blattae (strain ATCC 34711 / CBS 6284 / DSM 70876 / NBRC 10599 / NRRL Y-10934 / UCD 77-7) TaxID=1071380 RepID=I2H2D6_HENB6|nr:hypothetical protein TBLA_0D00280 [Tetrapisispora blattae CBS 6284]CCH60538.1 hypothetical protein TBLA_0D00280 [Tetrapisispora blattae CBS 6284]